MNILKIRKACQPIRIIAGLALIAVGVFTANPWFYLGVVPLIAGITNFCPLCMVTKKCEI